MYFEDILKIAFKYWQSPIDVNETGVYYMQNIDDVWKNEDEKHKYWVELLNWSIGVVIGAVSSDLKRQGVHTITIRDLSAVDVEKRFKEVDLKEESWSEERKQYKGFRDRPGENQRITEDYLASI
tara:strand:- start:34405 stop:34779 length:375 start_codon:yes stop_codon:yes gene_type:complete